MCVGAAVDLFSLFIHLNAPLWFLLHLTTHSLSSRGSRCARQIFAVVRVTFRSAVLQRTAAVVRKWRHHTKFYSLFSVVWRVGRIPQAYRRHAGSRTIHCIQPRQQRGQPSIVIIQTRRRRSTSKSFICLAEDAIEDKGINNS